MENDIFELFSDTKYDMNYLYLANTILTKNEIKMLKCHFNDHHIKVKDFINTNTMVELKNYKTHPRLKNNQRELILKELNRKGLINIISDGISYEINNDWISNSLTSDEQNMTIKKLLYIHQQKDIDSLINDKKIYEIFKYYDMLKPNITYMQIMRMCGSNGVSWNLLYPTVKYYKTESGIYDLTNYFNNKYPKSDFDLIDFKSDNHEIIMSDFERYNNKVIFNRPDLCNAIYNFSIEYNKEDAIFDWSESMMKFQLKHKLEHRFIINWFNDDLDDDIEDIIEGGFPTIVKSKTLSEKFNEMIEQSKKGESVENQIINVIKLFNEDGITTKEIKELIDIKKLKDVINVLQSLVSEDKIKTNSKGKWVMK